MESTSKTNSPHIGLIQCDKEPIHIPGSIQPFGVLLNVDRPNLIIRNASANSEAAWGIKAKELIGRSFAELVSVNHLALLQAYLDQADVHEQVPLTLSLTLPSTQPNQQWELSANEHAGCLILELETFAHGAQDSWAFHRQSRLAVQALHVTGSLQQLCNAAVFQMQEMTGFDRVMLYRFTEDWHGIVIAEACRPSMDSYLGHHFPASDIPAQARAVFLQNWLRMIPDVKYVPAPLHPGINPLNGAPLDLGRSTLRSVSPIHIEYLLNMGVQATLTVSLIDQGKLWGLIACHHSEPRRIDMDCRLGAKMIGQLVSSQIQVKQSLEDLQYRAVLRAVHDKLLEYMEQEEDLAQGLVKFSPTILDLANASGAAAAIYHDKKWTLLGTTPPMEEIEKLVDWLSTERAEETGFCTNSLSQHFAPAAAYKQIASGLLAVSIPKTDRNYILLFRPEVATTITWAGNPQKSVRQEGEHSTLHPRLSFASWKETVNGMAAPWKTVEIEAINELCNSLISLDLRREFKKEQLARAQAERLSREKENVVNIVSHDLRTPLAIAKMGFEFLQQFGKDRSAHEQEMIARGLRAAETIEQLANGVLDVARIDAGTLALDIKVASAEELVKDAIGTLGPLATQKGIHLHSVLSTHGAMLACDKERMAQVFANLISNAIKFTPPDGEIVVSVADMGNEVQFCVTDTGTGIAPEHLTKIFDRFWQEEHTKYQGTGLGLSIARGIVEKHNGSIWVQSKLGTGSQFYFCLPKLNA